MKTKAPVGGHETEPTMTTNNTALAATNNTTRPAPLKGTFQERVAAFKARCDAEKAARPAIIVTPVILPSGEMGLEIGGEAYTAAEARDILAQRA